MRPTIIALAVTLLSTTAWAAPPSETPPGLRENVRLHQVPERLALPALDVAKLRAEDARDRERGKPPRYAVPKEIAPVTPTTHGVWERLPDGGQVWRYRIHAEGATSVEPGFTRFHLPEGAALYVHGNDGQRVRGPYTHEDNESHGELWVPIVEGAKATVELELEPGVSREAVELEMTQVLQGYDEFWKTDPLTKTTNSCNVDVICPEAKGWEDQIASVAAYGLGRTGRICTGQMVNDTAFSGRPLFLTANHCNVRESNAASMVLYWNFENPTCRDITSSPGTSEPGNGSLDDAQSGAFFRARFVSSDFTLVELDDMPNPEWDVYWSGWDRRDTNFLRATGIHHPGGEEKRISFESDPLEIIGGAQPLDILSGQAIYQRLQNFDLGDTLPRSHLMVKDWDQGVTEQGSSGSGLWNPAKRLIGQLHGGGVHQCDDNDFDWYGRLWMSWEGGGTAETSLKPWLDPLGTGEVVLDGRDGDCNVPNVSIADNVQGPTAGESFTLTADGGNSNVEFFWDMDGDGIVDTGGRNAQVKFSSPGEREIKLIARNTTAQCGTTKTRTVTVKGPDLQVANVGTPRQLSGDDDDVIEPGERWDVPVTLINRGDARATGPRAVFTRAGQGDAEPVGPDGFGYTATGSLSSGNCRYQWVEIAGQNPRVQFTGANDFPSSDDGGSDPIAVDDFQFYNPGVSSIVMSTNGYLATSAARDGGDYSNKCPLPAVPDFDPTSGGTGLARLAAYHDDLVTGLGWHLRQDPCERPGDTNAGNGACHIFQWNQVEVLDPSTYGTANVEAFDIPEFEFQAILYEGSGEVVYQYGPNAPSEKATPTVGIQNNTASDGLTWGCSTHQGAEQAPLRPAPSSAVCFFHPKAAQIEFDPSGLGLETPALDYDNIPPGGNSTSRVAFTVADSAECGSDIGISLHGIVHDQGFSAGPGTIFSARIGGEDAVCDANVKAAAPKASIDFQPGMYYNPSRDGHGADIHIGAGGSQAFLVWYTYGPDRQPVWYLAVGDYEDDQIVADLLKFTDGDVNDPETVGKVIVTFTDETHAFFNWTLNGEKGGEPFEVLVGKPPPLDPNRTGHWFPPSQNGWGMTFNQQGQTEFDIVYFYDANGQPVWALGVKESASGKTVGLDQFKGVCPGCDWAPVSFQETGSLTRSFNGPMTGSVTTDIILKAPLDGNWKRGPVDIEILSDPVQ